MIARWPLLVLPWLGLACGKVPLFDIGVAFALADATWFEDEQTLFVFAEVQALQGIGPLSAIEISYVTDDEEVLWTPLSAFTPVHTHLPVDCGPDAICTSTSIFVDKEPRRVRLRLRYHPDGQLAATPQTVFNVVGSGPAHTNRSLLVYGVFDVTNTFVQWRARHQFPTIRNLRAQELGLRRAFQVTDQQVGLVMLPDDNNPYGYGTPCEGTLFPSDFPPVQTSDRAAFNRTPIPEALGAAPLVCAQATVTDALGKYMTGAVARRNPQVRPAFPVLRSPVRAARVLPFFLGPCDRTISEDHEEMQRQRLLLGDLPTTCTDDWQTPGYLAYLVDLFTDAIETARPLGDDMVLAIALHQDERRLAILVEDALSLVVPGERNRTSPRLAGAFVLDSAARTITRPELSSVALWCPAALNPAGGASLSCAVLPDIPGLVIGPLEVGFLPILPTRNEYLSFIDTFSKSQAGSVIGYEFLTPEFAATSEHFSLGPFGSVTFLNNESFGAKRTDAFSHCAQEEPVPVVVSSPGMRAVAAAGIAPQVCAVLGDAVEGCAALSAGVLPIGLLPAWHGLVGEENYQLGVFWEFPYLLRMDYRAVAAGAVSAFGLSVPFGIGGDTETFYGAGPWLDEEFPLRDELIQCTGFCGHPTFGSAGVYQIRRDFRTFHANTCYRPRFPRPGDSGFPLDP